MAGGNLEVGKVELDGLQEFREQGVHFCEVFLNLEVGCARGELGPVLLDLEDVDLLAHAVGEVAEVLQGELEEGESDEEVVGAGDLVRDAALILELAHAVQQEDVHLEALVVGLDLVLEDFRARLLESVVVDGVEHEVLLVGAV